MEGSKISSRSAASTDIPGSWRLTYADIEVTVTSEPIAHNTLTARFISGAATVSYFYGRP